MAKVKFDKVLNSQLTISEEAEESGLDVQTVRRQRIAALLVEAKKPEEICEKLGMSLATYYRDMKDPYIKDLVKEWREEVANKLVRGLTRMGDDAVRTLQELMLDTSVSAQTRSTIAFGVIDRLGGDVRVAQGQEQQRAVIVIERAADIVVKTAAQAQQERFAKLQGATEGEFRELGPGEAT